MGALFGSLPEISAPFGRPVRAVGGAGWRLEGSRVWSLAGLARVKRQQQVNTQRVHDTLMDDGRQTLTGRLHEVTLVNLYRLDGTVRSLAAPGAELARGW